MLRAITTFLRKRIEEHHPRLPAAVKEALEDDTEPIFEGLAMTDELREALFPTTPQMVSAIFDRPPPLVRPQEPSAAKSAPHDGGFPIMF